MAEIRLEGRVVGEGETIAGWFDVEDIGAGHLYLVYIDDDGQEWVTEVAGGYDGRHPEEGDMEWAIGEPMGVMGDIGTGNTYRESTPEARTARGSVLLDLGGRSAGDVWEQIKRAATALHGAEIDYQLAKINSNSTIALLLHTVGLESSLEKFPAAEGVKIGYPFWEAYDNMAREAVSEGFRGGERLFVGALRRLWPVVVGALLAFAPVLISQDTQGATMTLSRDWSISSICDLKSKDLKTFESELRDRFIGEHIETLSALDSLGAWEVGGEDEVPYLFVYPDWVPAPEGTSLQGAFTECQESDTNKNIFSIHLRVEKSFIRMLELYLLYNDKNFVARGEELNYERYSRYGSSEPARPLSKALVNLLSHERRSKGEWSRMMRDGGFVEYTCVAEDLDIFFYAPKSYEKGSIVDLEWGNMREDIPIFAVEFTQEDGLYASHKLKLASTTRSMYRGCKYLLPLLEKLKQSYLTPGGRE